MPRPPPPWVLLFVPFLLFLARAGASDCCRNDDPFDDLFFNARQLDSVPVEGITIDPTSSTTTNSYLNNGETEDLIFRFIFMPPDGISPAQYTLSFSCDNPLVYTTSSCSISSIITSITGSDATAYNTTVNCIYSRFPGSTQCSLSATLNNLAGRLSSQKKSFESVVSTRQTTSYESVKITNNVYGIVVYLPDSFGALSEEATIVSGVGNSYKVPNYYRVDAGIQQIQTYGVIPGGGSLQGSVGVTFFQTATVSVIVGDYITRYNIITCGLTNAALADTTFTLPESATCGVGVAVQSETTYPVFGVQFRTYKSGNFTLNLLWPSLGDVQDQYEQVLVLDIEEPAPPIVTALTKSTQYRSTPCEIETASMTAYNVRYADYRQLVVINSNGVNSTWLETAASFTYDSAADLSQLTFESGGGLGTDVFFILNATFGTEYRTGLIFDNDPILTFSFTSPPVLTGMSPTTVNVTGGETVTLTGTFDGFSSQDYVYIGGYGILGSATTITGTTQISFTTPARATLGQLYTYDVVVANCAERSSALTLSYITNPTVSIIATNTSADVNGVYSVPANDSAGFLASVSGNNEGVQYLWQIFSGGSEVSLGSTTNNLQAFTVSPNFFSASSVNYILRSTVTNSLGLSDQIEVSIQRLEEGSSYVFVTVYNVDNVSRSDDTTTLIQSTVATSSDSNVTLVWTYGSESYNVSDGTTTLGDGTIASQATANGTTTGPTKFGLEFNIARSNLRIGETTLTLTATLDSNPIISGSDAITVRVQRSALLAIINDGINGTLIQTGGDVRLFAGNSYDPDVLTGEGDSREGISYLWFTCSKSLQSAFSSGVESCDSLIPVDATASTITLSSADLLAQRLDTSTNPAPTFLSFGLRVSKENRVTDTYTYFELRTVETEQKVPTLTSLEIVDSKGVVMERTGLSTFSNIIIQPTAADTAVQWAFDMVQSDQRYLLATSGVLMLGSGFVSVRGEKSRLPLGFQANSLRPGTEYVIRVTASASDTALQTDFQIKFSTAQVPKLSCQPPAVQQGTVLDTVLTVTASLSFETQNIEYCFFLVGESLERFSLGKGCSSVPFATFTFPKRGIYDVECLAKSVQGNIIDNVTLDTNIVLSTPTPAPGLTEVQALIVRLNGLEATTNVCEARRDHSCLTSLIAVANSMALEVEAAIQNDNSAEAVQLLEATKAYIVKLSALSESLAQNTVFRPNQVEESIDQSFYLSHVPGTMIEDEGTLFATLRQMEGAVTSTESESTDPVIDSTLVAKVAVIANLSLTTAYNLAQGGTTRRRLLQTEQTRSSFATLQFRTPNFLAQIRAQQEGCGFLGEETTEYPAELQNRFERSTALSNSEIRPSRVVVVVACDEDQVNVPLNGVEVRNQVCRNVLSGQEARRLVPILIEIPEENIRATGLNNELDVYVSEVAYVAVKGIDALPDKCIKLRLARKQSTLITTNFDNLTAGTFEGLTADFPNVCTPTTCYRLRIDPTDTVTFTTTDVEITTKNQGLFVAGNSTSSRIAYVGPFTLEGFGLRGIGAIVRIVTTLAAFGVIALLVTWFAVTTVFGGAADVDATGWEYVERDMFGRGSVESNVDRASIGVNG